MNYRSLSNKYSQGSFHRKLHFQINNSELKTSFAVRKNPLKYFKRIQRTNGRCFYLHLNQYHSIVPNFQFTLNKYEKTYIMKYLTLYQGHHTQATTKYKAGLIYISCAFFCFYFKTPKATAIICAVSTITGL